MGKRPARQASLHTLPKHWGRKQMAQCGGIFRCRETMRQICIQFAFPIPSMYKTHAHNTPSPPLYPQYTTKDFIHRIGSEHSLDKNAN